jgi:hypothetical protein
MKGRDGMELLKTGKVLGSKGQISLPFRPKGNDGAIFHKLLVSLHLPCNCPVIALPPNYLRILVPQLL